MLCLALNKHFFELMTAVSVLLDQSKGQNGKSHLRMVTILSPELHWPERRNGLLEDSLAASNNSDKCLPRTMLPTLRQYQFAFVFPTDLPCNAPKLAP